MLMLAVYTRAGDRVLQVPFSSARLSDVADAGRSYLESPYAGVELDRYEITDAASGAIIHGRDRRNRAAPPIRAGERVAYCLADGDQVVMIEGTVRAIAPAPHNLDGPPCYHVRVEAMLADARRVELAAPIIAYPPTSTPPPGSPGGASIARLEPARAPVQAPARVPA